MLKRTFVRQNMGLGDAYVKNVFDKVAPKYDLMNDVLSLGIHRVWKDYLVTNCVRPQPGAKFLDVAGGTGDIAFRIIDQVRATNGAGAAAAMASAAAAEAGKAAPGPYVTVFDINAEMLAEGKIRAQNTGYAKETEFVEGNAEVLPFEDQTFDSYTVSFGIRNFSDRPKALREAHRVLKPGGVLNVLEFSHVTCPALAVAYEAHSKLMPLAGHLVAGDSESYQYLVDSIRAFPTQEEFANTINESGFGFVRYQNLTQGIACIHTAVKTV